LYEYVRGDITIKAKKAPSRKLREKDTTTTTTEVSRLIKTTIPVIGLHRWPGAKGKVPFLKNVHRHIFYITVTVKVTDSDREVEYFTLQYDIALAVNLLFKQTVMGYNFNTLSCEQISEKIGCYLIKQKYNVYEVETSEDHESSSVVRYE